MILGVSERLNVKLAESALRGLSGLVIEEAELPRLCRRAWLEGASDLVAAMIADGRGYHGGMSRSDVGADAVCKGVGRQHQQRSVVPSLLMLVRPYAGDGQVAGTGCRDVTRRDHHDNTTNIIDQQAEGGG